MALARALSPRPQILLADEPTGNLDGKTGDQVIDLLFDLQRRRQATLVLVTHDTRLAERCGRVVRMADGRIERGAGAGMTVAALDRPTKPAGGRRLPLVLSLALREQRNGLSGFYVFIACVALGVAAITGVGALADAMRASFERQGEVLLGGDVTLSRPHKAAEGAERAWLWQQGRVSEIGHAARHGAAAGRLRADAGRAAGASMRAYPLVGIVPSFRAACPSTKRSAQAPGAAVDPILLERLGLKIGDPLSLGTIQVPIRATIEAEPDKLTERLTVGPRVLVSLETLAQLGPGRAGQPGHLALCAEAAPTAPARADASLVSFREAAKKALPEAGFTVRDRRDPSPQIIAHAGAAAPVPDAGRPDGAAGRRRRHRQRGCDLYRPAPQGHRRLQEPGRHARVIFGVHLAAGAAVLRPSASCSAMAVGLLMPGRAHRAAGRRRCRSRPSSRSAPAACFTAAAYGFLVALLFTLWPLGRAEQVRAGVLFRDEVAPERVLPGRACHCADGGRRAASRGPC